MRIAIHCYKGSFSDRWIEYCKKENISFKIVNCYDADIIFQVRDCSAVMWHHQHAVFQDVISARKILYALEHAGLKVFPDFNTAWHFDDKVAQKYLLEAIDAPLVPSYVFYDKSKALHWAKHTRYPKVFKLKGGAGSANVKLVRNNTRARKLIHKAFGRGFSQFDRWGYLKERYRIWREGRGSLLNVMKGIGRLLIPTKFAKMLGREKGYVYFQDFIPGNTFDIRVVIVANKAFALKRLVRPNDFRASGSGKIVYDKNEINTECIKSAFEINKKIQSQSIAFDFIFDKNRNPLVVEISYGYAVEAYDYCPGYWDQHLKWHEEKFNHQEWMVEDLIKQISNDKKQ